MHAHPTPCRSTYGISKQTSPYCLNLEHAKLQNGTIIYGQSFYLYRIMHPLNRFFFFFSKTHSHPLYGSMIFFFSLEFVIKVILKHTIKKWHIHLRILDQTKSCCTFLNQKKTDFMNY